jgi:hypothetical protein
VEGKSLEHRQPQYPDKQHLFPEYALQTNMTIKMRDRKTYCLIGSRTGFDPLPLGVETGFTGVGGISSKAGSENNRCFSAGGVSG